MGQARRAARGRLPAIMSRRSLWFAFLGLILALAWFDGGEEPIRQIIEPIAVPEGR